MEYSIMKEPKMKTSLILLLLALGVGWLFRFNEDSSGNVTRHREPNRSASSAAQHRMAAESIRSRPVSNRQSDLADDASARLARQVEGLDGEAVWRELQGLSPAELRGDRGRLLVYQWGKTSPMNALAWAGDVSEAPLRDEMIAVATLGWAGSDLDGAIKWVLSQSAGEARNKLLITLGHEWVRTNPKDVISLAVSLPVSPERDQMMTRAAAEWAVTDGSAALSWARGIAEPERRAQTLAGVAVAISEQDPEAAANVVANELTAGRLQDDAVVAIVQRWAQTKPEDAAAWVSHFSDGQLFNASVENLVKIWSTVDARQLHKWMVRLPAGSMREQAFLVYQTNVVPANKEPD
jgi:hypothetical protein